PHFEGRTNVRAVDERAKVADETWEERGIARFKDLLRTGSCVREIREVLDPSLRGACEDGLKLLVRSELDRYEFDRAGGASGAKRDDDEDGEKECSMHGRHARRIRIFVATDLKSLTTSPRAQGRVRSMRDALRASPPPAPAATLPTPPIAPAPPPI